MSCMEVPGATENQEALSSDSPWNSFAEPVGAGVTFESFHLLWGAISVNVLIVHPKSFHTLWCYTHIYTSTVVRMAGDKLIQPLFKDSHWLEALGTPAHLHGADLTKIEGRGDGLGVGGMLVLRSLIYSDTVWTSSTPGSREFLSPSSPETPPSPHEKLPAGLTSGMTCFLP